jgi:DNA-directed RNA polymerase sigma subunit (sigma70/sigma32)
MGATSARYLGPSCSTSPLALSAEEETRLCRLCHEHHDVGAAEQLIRCHMRQVARIAFAYRSCGAPAQPLIAEGYFGLMHGECRYDPACGTPFATYTTWWVQAGIRQSILHATAAKPAANAPDAVIAMPRLKPHGRDGRRSTRFVSH